MVEHTAVNRGVAGSSPARGVFKKHKSFLIYAACYLEAVPIYFYCIRPHGQAVKTSPFHGGNTGSIPVGVIFMPIWLNWQSS